MNWLHITSNLYFFVSRPTSTTKSWNSSIDISIASAALSSEIERQYARKIVESSPKRGCMRLCSSSSQSGKPSMSMHSTRDQQSIHLACAAAFWPASGFASVAKS